MMKITKVEDYALVKDSSINEDGAFIYEFKLKDHLMIERLMGCLCSFRYAIVNNKEFVHSIDMGYINMDRYILCLICTKDYIGYCYICCGNPNLEIGNRRSVYVDMEDRGEFLRDLIRAINNLAEIVRVWSGNLAEVAE